MCSGWQITDRREQSVSGCRLKRQPEGYEALPDKPRPGAWAVDIKQRQEDFAADVEKALMETYNALYKLQEAIPPVRAHPGFALP